MGWEVSEGQNSSDRNIELYECLQVIECLSESIAQAMAATNSGPKFLRQIRACLSGGLEVMLCVRYHDLASRCWVAAVGFEI